MTVSFSNDSGTTWKTPDDFSMIIQPGHGNALAPPIASRSVAIPGLPGSIYFGAELGDRAFTFPLVFPYAATRAEMQLSLREWVKFLFDGTGKPRAILVKYDYDGDKYFTTYYDGDVPVERDFTLGYFILQLTAFDPIAYLTQNVGDLTWDSDLIMDDCDLTFDDAFTFADINAETDCSVNNFGALNVRPTITVTGSFTTLTITIGDDTLTYSEALSAATLTLDLKKRTAKVGATNKNSKVSGDWPELATGVNTVTIGGTGLNCDVNFVFKTQYL